MKKTVLLSFTALSLSAAAQNVFWTETFGTGCNQGAFAGSYTGTNGTWTTAATGTNDTEANQWFVSATAPGMAPGSCGGNGCPFSSLTDQTLHIGSIDTTWSAADPGANYHAGGMCGTSVCVTTNIRAESPVINCSGKAGITLTFNYVENGDGANDDGSVWYYDGTVWSLLVNTAKTAVNCPLYTGRWTSFSIALPANADNNPNVKIGFNWTNNDDGIGTDPSFAVDSVQLLFLITGIEEVAASAQVIASGNTILVKSTAPYTVTSITDVSGRSISYEREGDILSVNASEGIYFLTLQVGQSLITRKVYLQRE